MNSNVSNHLSLTITKSRRIQDGAKSFASEEGQKLHGAKITPYTVARLTTVQAVANKPLKTRKTVNQIIHRINQRDNLVPNEGN